MIFMDGNYELSLGDRKIGSVQVRKQGLYYHFSCRCALSGNAVCRLLVSCGGRQENVGVLVPMEGRFGIEKQIPVKRLGEGKPEFQLVTRQERQTGSFVPIYPEEPFEYIHKLENAFLVHQAGQLGIVIREA